MRNVILALTASTFIAAAAGTVNAQPGGRFEWAHDQGSGHRWSSGERMGYNDWGAAQRVDYHRHHLRAPPQGYEWRRSNGQYILAAVATGLIASAIFGH